MNKEEKNISCDVCLDLIPLVRDKVASDDSNVLVHEHIKNCEDCKAEFENGNCTSGSTEDIIDDKKIIKSIKKSLYLTIFVFIVCGAILGVYLSNSFGMLYNLLIMPIVGGCGYLVLKRKAYLISIGIFVLSYAWLFIKNITDGALEVGLTIELFSNPLLLTIIYTALSILGVIIAALLKFAFRKEVSK